MRTSRSARAASRQPGFATLGKPGRGPNVEVDMTTQSRTRTQELDAVFGGVTKSARCAEKMQRTLEEVLQLGVEIAREGREGRKIGTLFVVGDVDRTLERSRPLLLDPLYGHAA